MSIIWTTLPPSMNQAPSIPGSLAASNVANTSLTLSWTASTDPDGTIAGYEYRVEGGSAVDVGLVLTSAVTGLSAGTTYSFEVRSYDNQGLRSAWSSPINQPTTGSVPQVIKVLYTVDSDAGDFMSIADTGPEGLSSFAAGINGMTDAKGNTYQVTEVDADLLVILTAPGGVNDIRSYDIWITGSCNRVFVSGEESIIDGLVRAGDLAVFGYSDSAMLNSGGYQNQGGQASRHSMGFPLWGWQVFVDQVDNVQTRSLPSGHFLGDGIQFQGEGTSPWIIDGDTNNHASQGFPIVVTARPDQTPSHTQGITFTGTVTDLGYSTPGSGRVLVLFDRQPFWNGGAGSDITQVDNQEFLENCVQWLAGGIDHPTSFDQEVASATEVLSIMADMWSVGDISKADFEAATPFNSGHWKYTTDRFARKNYPAIGKDLVQVKTPKLVGTKDSTWNPWNRRVAPEIDWGAKYLVTEAGVTQASYGFTWLEFYFQECFFTGVDDEEGFFTNHTSKFVDGWNPGDVSSTGNNPQMLDDSWEAVFTLYWLLTLQNNSYSLNSKGDFGSWQDGQSTIDTSGVYNPVIDLNDYIQMQKEFFLGVAFYAHDVRQTYNYQNMCYFLWPGTNYRIIFPVDSHFELRYFIKPNTPASSGPYDGQFYAEMKINSWPRALPPGISLNTWFTVRNLTDIDYRGNGTSPVLDNGNIVFNGGGLGDEIMDDDVIYSIVPGYPPRYARNFGYQKKNWAK